MKTTLILGYGNADRQDDGVAWHVLARLARKLGQPAPSTPDDEFAGTGEPGAGPNPALIFALQLTPEMAETIARYERVCFVDAHTGRVPQEIQFAPLKSEFQSSPFTHHMTAETCLALAGSLYGRQPAEAVLVSVRGYEFGFSHELSPRTAELAEEATEQIRVWL